MVDRAEPLVVDVLVAALAGIRFHEEFAGNLLLAVDLRRTGKKCALGAIAFVIHAGGRHCGIGHVSTLLPARLADIARSVAQSGESEQADDDTGDCCSAAFSQPAALSDPIGEEQANSRDRQNDVQIQPFPLRPRRAQLYLNRSKQCSSSNERPSTTGDNRPLAQQATQSRRQQHRSQDACERMQQHDCGIKDVRLRKGVEVSGGDRQKDDQARERALRENFRDCHSGESGTTASSSQYL